MYINNPIGIFYKSRFSIISFGIDNDRNRFYKPFSKQTLHESVFQFESDSYNKIVIGIWIFLYCTLYIVQCTVYNAQCTMYTIE